MKQIPNSGNDCSCSRANDIDELIDVQFTITIYVTNSKQSLNLLVGEPRS